MVMKEPIEMSYSFWQQAVVKLACELWVEIKKWDRNLQLQQHVGLVVDLNAKGDG